MSNTLTIQKLTISTTVFDAMPPEKRLALLHLGMFLNDANWLRKLLVGAVIGMNEEGPEGEASFGLTVLMATTLAGKIYEGWLRMSDGELRAVLNSLPMPPELKTLQAEVDGKLSSKLFLRLRNNPAFHYPQHRLQFTKLKAHLSDEDLFILVTESGYVGDVFSRLSLLAGIEPVMANDPSADYRIALEAVWNEITDTAGKYCLFVSEAQACLLMTVMPPDGWPTETLTVEDAPEVEEQSIRFFMRPPA